jgi:hypothetical protein
MTGSIASECCFVWACMARSLQDANTRSKRGIEAQRKPRADTPVGIVAMMRTACCHHMHAAYIEP